MPECVYEFCYYCRRTETFRWSSQEKWGSPPFSMPPPQWATTVSTLFLGSFSVMEHILWVPVTLWLEMQPQLCAPALLL